jgi:predicted regulator of Ras-like GTPase activity (Roadblock/LC7/MglB family)
MSNIVRSKFAGLLRGLLRRFDDDGAGTVASPSPLAAATGPRGLAPAAVLQPKLRANYPPPATPPAPPAAGHAGAGGLQLPLSSVVAVLPIDLRAKLLESPPANAAISIPVEKVLSQLAHGAVKITFGELRAARPGLFANSSENDARQIVLPLNEIITRISPTLLSRRTAKAVEPADDIAGPFGIRTPGLNLATAPVPARNAPAPVANAPRPAPAAAAATFTRRPVAGQKAAAAVPRTAPPSPAASSTPVKRTPAAPRGPAAPIPFSPAPVAAAKNSESPAQVQAEPSLLVPLSELAEKWPEAIRLELTGAELMSSQAALPVSLVEPGLKQGRVTILWKKLRMMIQPNPAPVSVHDNAELELPLKVLAPLFFGSQKAAAQAKRRISASPEIPDVFPALAPAIRQSEIATSFTPAPVAAPRPAPAAVVPAAPAAPAPSRPAKRAFPAPPAAPANKATPEHNFVSAPLSVLSEKWPEALQTEISQWNLPEAQIVLPVDTLAPAMKCGRVKFAWRELRAWIQPAPAATETLFDGVELELPLKVIAPLFLAQQTPPARPSSRFAVDQSIPSPFFGLADGEVKVSMPAAPVAVSTPKPAPPALKSVDARLSETNYYVWGDTSDTPRVDQSEYKRAQAPATDFTSRSSTPKEIVARTAKLPGVAGVVIALCDGLLIASQVPTELNPDTAAAFLPQIFDRVAQSTRELRMGPLNNLKFTVGNVPWQIFHVNAIYFAVFGRPGEALPTSQLTSLAAELDRKKQ